MAKVEPTCGTCGYWQTGHPRVGEGSGFCRRYPPPVVASQQGPMAVCPVTSGTLDWCGEHEVFPQRPFVMPGPTAAQILMDGQPSGLMLP
jgi:hypothetical protein